MIIYTAALFVKCYFKKSTKYFYTCRYVFPPTKLCLPRQRKKVCCSCSSLGLPAEKGLFSVQKYRRAIKTENRYGKSITINNKVYKGPTRRKYPGWAFLMSVFRNVVPAHASVQLRFLCPARWLISEHKIAAGSAGPAFLRLRGTRSRFPSGCSRPPV